MKASIATKIEESFKDDCYIDLEKLNREIKSYTETSIRPSVLFVNEDTINYLVSKNCLNYRCSRDNFKSGFFYKDCLVEINEFLDFGEVKIC